MKARTTVFFLALLGIIGCDDLIDITGDYTTAPGGSGGMAATSGHSSMGGSSGNCHNLPNTPMTCGNGTVDGGEECDDGNCVASDTCNNNCKQPYCGDGVVQPPEVCDDGENCPPSCCIPPTSSSGMVDP